MFKAIKWRSRRNVYIECRQHQKLFFTLFLLHQFAYFYTSSLSNKWMNVIYGLLCYAMLAPQQQQPFQQQQRHNMWICFCLAYWAIKTATFVYNVYWFGNLWDYRQYGWENSLSQALLTSFCQLDVFSYCCLSHVCMHFRARMNKTNP